MTALSAVPKRFKLIFFVPPSGLPACKAAIFAAGAGRYPGPGNYTECCWATIGTAQFRPGDTANPNIGTVGALEEVQEVRFETLCVGEETIRNAVAALKKFIHMRNRLMKFISWRIIESGEAYVLALLSRRICGEQK